MASPSGTARATLFPDGCSCGSYGRGLTMTRVTSDACDVHGNAAPDPPVAVPGPASELLPCTCPGSDEPYCPRHTPLPGESAPDHQAVTFQCPSCDGDGYNDRWLEDSEGRDFPVSIPCERCDGTGELRDDGKDDPDA